MILGFYPRVVYATNWCVQPQNRLSTELASIKHPSIIKKKVLRLRVCLFGGNGKWGGGGGWGGEDRKMVGMKKIRGWKIFKFSLHVCLVGGQNLGE